MVEKKLKRRQRAQRAFIAIHRRQSTTNRKTPSAEIRKNYELYAQHYPDGCDGSDPGCLLAWLKPDDLTEARIRADFALCMTAPRCADRLGMSVAEFRRERDRALERLEAATHQLSLVECGGSTHPRSSAIEPVGLD
jgi:hypothetical protein